MLLPIILIDIMHRPKNLIFIDALFWHTVFGSWEPMTDPTIYELVSHQKPQMKMTSETLPSFT